MAAFQNHPDEWSRLDFKTLRDGYALMYWKSEILEKDLKWFEEENYHIVQFDCTSWLGDDSCIDWQEMHRQLQQKLNFAGYYGRNFDALNDCLSDLEITGTGLVVVFRQMDSIDSDNIFTLLDVFAINSRLHLLFGHRFIILLQVDNPRFEVNSIGSKPVLWNRAEWLNAKREVENLTESN